MWDSALALLPSAPAWCLYFFCAILIGISKTGIQNVGTFAIPLFALLFGAKFSTGIVLILLCMADVLAVVYYRKELLWSEIKSMLPFSLIGLIIGLFVGDYINDQTFKFIMGACILLSVLLMIWVTHRANKTNLSTTDLTNKRWYSPSFGLLVGFSTMIGNAAGPALTIYLLTRRLDKVTLVATGAWLIMILNFSKIPLQWLVWDNLSWEGLILNALAFPFILLGGYIGIRLVKVIPEKEFRIIILALVIVASLMLLFG
ncbi:MAG: sulfite exporter TauE/SafE family protein [Sphingobacterium sp.]